MMEDKDIKKLKAMIEDFGVGNLLAEIAACLGEEAESEESKSFRRGLRNASIEISRLADRYRVILG